MRRSRNSGRRQRAGRLSYANTHPMFTKRNFPNFYRIVPNVRYLDVARVEFVKLHGWKRVGTLCQDDPRYTLVRNNGATPATHWYVTRGHLRYTLVRNIVINSDAHPQFTKKMRMLRPRGEIVSQSIMPHTNCR
ncbi:Gamma-aminobutyric acid type B receptor subunit 2 [Amphibalanus amphitrite]|uniref:Gamma-aminobutyric acid type B receptor subunit 2 n=1 Tax=Amphibalanus amphitrite TaxID=1232801 RepID=A0A6A4UZ98_AMPAM|nr:Gamma-aminobutyric acid type B receptor subunit 2 [Amphibalanus amphitrite]